MTKKLKQWGEKPLSGKIFLVSMGFAAICALFAFTWFLLYDSDMYFMIASGREILANGIPRENVWYMDPGYGIVVQQWLYDVILALVDPLGAYGFAALVLLAYALFAFLSYRLFRKAGVGSGIAVLFLAAASLFFREYVFSIRPQTATFILLLLTAMCIESYCEKGDWLYLVPLPIATLIEINLHGAMWPFHFCVVAAYLVPLPFPKGQKLGEAKYLLHHLKETGLALLAMVVSLFLNPYGTDGIAYVFRSYGSGCFDMLHVTEMARSYVLSSAGVCLIVGLILVGICAKLGTLRSGTFNMFLGFGIASVLAHRNYMFLILPFLFLLRDLHDGCSNRIASIDFKGSLTRSTIPALLLLDVCALLMVIGTAGSTGLVDGGSSGTSCRYDAMAEFLESEDAYDARIFTQSEIGSLLEYRGFTGIYMDNRPEIYMSDINGVHDVASDLSRYACYGITLAQSGVRTPSDYYPVTADEMAAWLEYCQFDYICLGAWSTTFLQGYLMNCPDYEIVYDEPGWATVYARAE